MHTFSAALRGCRSTGSPPPARTGWRPFSVHCLEDCPYAEQVGYGMRTDPASTFPPSDPGTAVVEPVHRGRDLDRFIRLPWRVYAHNACWVPPLLSEPRRLLAP